MLFFVITYVQYVNYLTMSAAIYSFYEEGYVMSTNRVQLPNYPFIQSKLSSPMDFRKNYEKLFP